MDILEAMKQRRSVRTYDGRPLDSDTVAALRKAVDESYTLFGGSLTVRLKSFDIQGDYKPATYGVIKGASDFFLLAMGSDEDSALSAGFRFEQVVLQAWRMGLGTCWIAGTFKGSQFDKDETWPEGESLKIICPVGVPVKQRFMEKMMRFTVGSKGRKPFSELFFNRSFGNPLNPDSPFAESLEMLRLAPSSTNSQPWRVVVEGDKVHFYCRKRNIISVVDCGIGICHFYETERFRGFDGTFAKDTHRPAPSEGLDYIVSYTRN